MSIVWMIQDSIRTIALPSPFIVNCFQLFGPFYLTQKFKLTSKYLWNIFSKHIHFLCYHTYKQANFEDTRRAIDKGCDRVHTLSFWLNTQMTSIWYGFKIIKYSIFVDHFVLIDTEYKVPIKNIEIPIKNRSKGNVTQWTYTLSRALY